MTTEIATWECNECGTEKKTLLGESPDNCFCGGGYSRVFVADGQRWKISLVRGEK